MKRIIYLTAATLLLAFVHIGCSDDVSYPSTKPDIEINEGHTVSSFSLQTSHFNFPENVDSVRVALINASGYSECFGAGVKRSDDTIRFNMYIPEAEALDDGKYVLTMCHPDGSPIPGRLKAEFKSKMLSSVSIIIPKYMLDGSGTADDPYLITSDDDFSMFLINLADDADSYGAGLVFKQTCDVNAPDQSSLIPGRGYWGAPFAGIYDGDNHTIRNLFYRGSQRESSDSGIGLFTELLGTASVSDLSLTGVAMSGLYKESGAIAGHVSGEVSLSGISATGYIDGGDAIGGMVGNVKNGKLSMSDISLCMGVSGKGDIGGLAGRVDKEASLTVNGVTTPGYQFVVSGDNSVGGVAGRIIGKSDISNVRLDHKVSGEDSDIKIIEGKTGCVGGVIGTIEQDAASQTLTKCVILCPVGGTKADCAGGLIGYSSQSTPLTISDCRVQSVVAGYRYTGGIIGKADFPSNSAGLIVIGTDFSTRVSADDSDAKVTGEEYTGGFAGWWKGGLQVCVPIRINLPVTGDKYVGGAFGGISHSTVHTENIIFGNGKDNSSPITLRVTGKTTTGGFVGMLSNSTLIGTNKFELSQNFLPSTLPDAVSEFSGVVMGGNNTGGMIGHAEGSVIEYLCSAATVNGTKNVGGIVGYFKEPGNSTRIKSCYFKGCLDLPGVSNVGGIVGYYYSQAMGEITSCVNSADIRGGNCTGGIGGYIQKSVPSENCSAEERHLDLSWCINRGDIEGHEHIGGIAGFFDSYFVSDYTSVDMLLSYSMNQGNISGDAGNSSSGIGGVVGNVGANSGVMFCANHGDVTGKGNFHGVGGVIGVAGMDAYGTGLFSGYRNTDIKECMNTATITSTDKSSYVGGVIGYLEEGVKSDVNNCHNLGAVPCQQSHDSGGIIGCVDHLTNIHRVVNQGMVSHGNATIGTHKSGSTFDHSSLYYLEGTGSSWPSATRVSKSNFSKQSSFGGLDFKAVWEMSSSGPVLARCPFRKPLKN